MLARVAIFVSLLALGLADEPELAEEQPECSVDQCQAVVDQLPPSLAPYAGCTSQCVVMVPLAGYDESNGKPTIIAVKDGELHEALEELAEEGDQQSKRLRLGRKIELNDREKRPSFIRIGKRPSFIRIGRGSVSRLLRLGKRPSFIRIGK